MCTSPRFIYTNARYLSGISRYVIRVPCGKCEECKAFIRNQYLVRSYYEALRVKKYGGVSVFQTLTYDDAHIPSLYGIKCFRYSDLVNFRKRLRSNLIRAGYDSSKMSYFIAAEYGDNTARPHYHIICNAWFKGATAHLLHDEINKAWGFGFTDKRIKQICLNDSAGLGALAYVTKYVSKSIGDSDSLEIAIKQGVSNLSEKQVKDLFENHKEDLKIKHFQSRGYGEYLLELVASHAIIHNVDIAKEFHENNRVMLPDKKHYYKFYPLGHYYIYKVMYDRVYNPVTCKNDVYVLNEIGRKWRQGQYLDARDKMIDRFVMYKPNILSFIRTHLNEGSSEFSTDHLLRLYTSIKNDKFDIKSFCEYILFYRNLSWIDSQYCPFELFSFEKDVLEDITKPKYIENRCYEKKFVDANGKVITKPYQKSFRSRLVSRSYDVVSRLPDDVLFAALFPIYLEVFNGLAQIREDESLRKAKANDDLHRIRLMSEIVIN